MARAHNELLDIHDKIEDERLSGVSLAGSGAQARPEGADDRGNRPLRPRPERRAGQGPAAERRSPVGGVRGRARRRARSAHDALRRRLRLVRCDQGHTGPRPHRWTRCASASRRAGRNEEVARRLQRAVQGNPGARSRAAPRWRRPWPMRGSSRNGVRACAVASRPGPVERCRPRGFRDAAGPRRHGRRRKRRSSAIIFQVNEVTVPKLDPASQEAGKIEQALRAAYSEETDRAICRAPGDGGGREHQPVGAQPGRRRRSLD